MSNSVEFAIIGGGSAGLTALREIRKETNDFMIISDTWGTTCASVGCMPSKAFIESANALHRTTSFETLGLDGSDSVRPDIPRILERVRRLRDDFVSGPASIPDELGGRAITSRARLLEPGVIELGDRRITAKNTILAPGSSPIVPDAWQSLGDQLVTTDSFFELKNIPPRVGVIGLGAIGMELALAMARLGIGVVGIDAGSTLAGITDPEIRQFAIDHFGSEFDIILNSEADLITSDETVKIKTNGSECDVDLVLAVVGRKPNVDALGLNTLGVALDDNGLPKIDPNSLRIGDLDIWLAGDANGVLPLLHEAADEGFIAARNAISGETQCFRRRTEMAVTFSAPDIVKLGAGFDDLDGAETVIGTSSYAKQGRARTAEQNAGQIRVYADKSTGTIKGAEMCAPAGEHLAHFLALAMESDLSVDDMLGAPFYHPTLEEGLRTALRSAARQVSVEERRFDLSQCPEHEMAALD